MTDTLIAELRSWSKEVAPLENRAADRIEELQAEVYMVQQIGRYWESKAAELQSRLTALESDKEVLLGHMDTINRCSNDPAIYNLSKVVIDRFALGAAPQQAEPANTNYSNAQHPDWGGIKQAEPKEQT